MKDFVLDDGQRALLVLLREGLWERETDGRDLFPLPEEQWNRVFRMACMQTVTGIAYNGLCRLPDEWLPSQLLLMKWVAEADRIERENRRMNEVLAGLCELFRNEGIRVVLQKGQGVALLYEKPSLRQCGDIDFYFLSETESQAAARLMQQKGCRLHTAPDGSVCYRWQGIEIEHHPALLDLQNPHLRGYLQELIAEKGFDKGYEDTILFPSPFLHLILLNVHILKHAFGVGIGLRQFCDLARAYFVWQNQVDADELQTFYNRAGLTNWSRLLHAFLVQHLGLPAGCLPVSLKPVTSCDALTRIVFRGGNFGQYRKGRQSVSERVWQRKWHTFSSFLANWSFACNYAPKEYFWTMMGLLKGQSV